MTNQKKYTIFVVVISVCYLALPYFFTTGGRSDHNAERVVTVFVLGLVARLFDSFYLDVLLIILPLTYVLLKEKIVRNRFNGRALLLLIAFFAAVYRGHFVGFCRFSHDLISAYADIRKWHIIDSRDRSLSNFAKYTYNMPITYYSKMDEDTRVKMLRYVPGFALRVWVSVVVAVSIGVVFYGKSFFSKTE